MSSLTGGNCANARIAVNGWRRNSTRTIINRCTLKHVKHRAIHCVCRRLAGVSLEVDKVRRVDVQRRGGKARGLHNHFHLPKDFQIGPPLAVSRCVSAFVQACDKRRDETKHCRKAQCTARHSCCAVQNAQTGAWQETQTTITPRLAKAPANAA